MSWHENAPSPTEMRFETVEYKFWFPPIAYEDVRRMRMAEYLETHPDSITYRHNDISINEFARVYSSRVREDVIWNTGQNTNAAIVIADKVIFDQVRPIFVARNMYDDTTSFFIRTQGVQQLEEAMSYYFEAKQSQRWGLFRQKPAREANSWMFNTFHPWLRAYVENTLIWGDVSQYGDGGDEADLVIQYAQGFLASIGGTDHIEIEFRGHSYHSTGWAFLADPGAREILEKAMNRGGTINGIEIDPNLIPWDLLA